LSLRLVHRWLFWGALALTLVGCAQNQAVDSNAAKAAEGGGAAPAITGAGGASDLAARVAEMLAPWPGPYGGVPQFQWLHEPDYLAALQPAIETAIARHKAEIDAIVANPAAPTFANTVAALENSGAALDSVMVYWSVWSANQSTPEFRTVQKAVAPVLARYRAEVNQNQALFERVAALQNSPEAKALAATEQRLLTQHFDRFARNGATLEGSAAERYTQIQSRLADLQTRFTANMLADEEGYVTYLSAGQLGGLPDSVVSAAAQAAADRDRPGEWAITNTRSSMREQVWRNYYARGDNRGEHDNVPLIGQILRLRHERVQLLGFDSYAQWRLANRMAQTPQRAEQLLMQLWPAAVAKVEREVADMQERSVWV